MIKNSGFYLGKGRIYEDWHAGINFKSQNFSILKFFKNGTVIKKSDWIYLDEIQENLKKFLKDFIDETRINIDMEELIKIGYWVGNFIEEDKILQVKFKFNDNTYTEVYTFITPNIILNENLDEFHFERIDVELM